MTGTERKRIWRRDHPEQSREAERVRANARRTGYWGTSSGSYLVVLSTGETPRPCASQDSYYRYEWSTRRFLQRINWPKIGPGSMKMSSEERGAAFDAAYINAVRALGVQYGIELDGTESSDEFNDKMLSAALRELDPDSAP